MVIADYIQAHEHMAITHLTVVSRLYKCACDRVSMYDSMLYTFQIIMCAIVPNTVIEYTSIGTSQCYICTYSMCTGATCLLKS